MTYVRTKTLPNGDIEEIRTNPGAPLRIFINGVQTSGPGMPLEPPPWREHYALIPRRINGRWYWLTTVYRKFLLSPGGGFYRYGDIFDVLK